MKKVSDSPDFFEALSNPKVRIKVLQKLKLRRTLAFSAAIGLIVGLVFYRESLSKLLYGLTFLVMIELYQVQSGISTLNGIDKLKKKKKND